MHNGHLIIKFLRVCQRMGIEQRFLVTDWLINEPKLDRYNYKNEAYLTKNCKRLQYSGIYQHVDWWLELFWRSFLPSFRVVQA